jgi:hypothetical protein
MAKRTSGARSSEAGATRVAGFAEDLGRILGTAQARASAWLNQRQQISKQLTQVRDTAERLLREIAGSGAGGGRRGRRPSTAVVAGEAPPVRRRRRISAAARRKMSEAAKRRWAAIKAKGGRKTKGESVS